MLSFLVNNKKYNCFDVEESQLREWSKNGDMFCVGCGKRMIYNHGEIRDFVYLRHFRKDEECEYKKDSEEHDKGKLLLYNYLKNVKDIKNLDIERKIDSGQITDIYFEYKNEKYCIEYQCTPIATPLLQRSRKYYNNGYNVIWIFGTKNYGINNKIQYIEEKGIVDFCVRDYKTIASEREMLFECDLPLLYFNPDNEKLYQVKFNSVVGIPKRKTMFNFDIEVINLYNFNIIDFIGYKHYENVKNNIINWIKSINGLEIVNFSKQTKHINPIVCCKFDESIYGIEYIRKPIDEEKYENIINEYKNYNIVPIIFLDATLHRVKSNTEYIAYSILGRYYLNAKTGEINILCHIGTEVWGYWTLYNMQKYNPCTTQLNNCWFVGEGIENQFSSEYRLKELIKNYKTLKYIQHEKMKDELYKEHRKILDEHILETEIIFVDGNFKNLDAIKPHLFNINITKDNWRFYDNIQNLKYEIKKHNKNPIYLLVGETIKGQTISNHRRIDIINNIKEYGFKNVRFYKEDSDCQIDNYIQ